MARYAANRIRSLFKTSDSESIAKKKGTILENIVCYLFEKVPGITVTEKNAYNNSGSEEIDIAFWNEKFQNGLHFLPHILLVECKNWSGPVGTKEIAWFKSKLEERGRDIGFFIAAHGITGNKQRLRDSQYEIAKALRSGIQILIFSRVELENLKTTDEFSHLIKKKLCKLAVLGSADYE